MRTYVCNYKYWPMRAVVGCLARGNGSKCQKADSGQSEAGHQQQSGYLVDCVHQAERHGNRQIENIITDGVEIAPKLCRPVDTGYRAVQPVENPVQQDKAQGRREM